MPPKESRLKLAAAGSPNVDADTKGVDGRTVERRIAQPSVNEKITWQHVIRDSYGADQDTVAKCVMQKGGILENDNLQMQILNAVGAGMEECHKLHAHSFNVSPDADWDEVTTLMYPTHNSMARKSFPLQDAKSHKPSHQSTNCTNHYAGTIGMFKSLTSAGFPNQQNVDDQNRSRLSMPAAVAIREVYLPIWSADAAVAWAEFDEAQMRISDAGPMGTRTSPTKQSQAVAAAVVDQNTQTSFEELKLAKYYASGPALFREFPAMLPSSSFIYGFGKGPGGFSGVSGGGPEARPEMLDIDLDSTPFKYYKDTNTDWLRIKHLESYNTVLGHVRLLKLAMFCYIAKLRAATARKRAAECALDGRGYFVFSQQFVDILASVGGSDMTIKIRAVKCFETITKSNFNGGVTGKADRTVERGLEILSTMTGIDWLAYGTSPHSLHVRETKALALNIKVSTVACRAHQENLKRLQALYEQTSTDLQTTPNAVLQTWCDTIQATFPTLFPVAVAEAVADPPMAIQDRGAALGSPALALGNHMEPTAVLAVAANPLSKAKKPKRRRKAAAPTEQPPNNRPRRAGSDARPGAPKKSAH